MQDIVTTVEQITATAELIASSREQSRIFVLRRDRGSVWRCVVQNVNAGTLVSIEPEVRGSTKMLQCVGSCI